MYGIYANIWGILMVNVTIYGIHTDPMGMGFSIAMSDYGRIIDGWSLVILTLSPLAQCPLRPHLPGRGESPLCWWLNSHFSWVKSSFWLVPLQVVLVKIPVSFCLRHIFCWQLHVGFHMLKFPWNHPAIGYPHDYGTPRKIPYDYPKLLQMINHYEAQ